MKKIDNAFHFQIKTYTYFRVRKAAGDWETTTLLLEPEPENGFAVREDSLMTCLLWESHHVTTVKTVGSWLRVK